MNVDKQIVARQIYPDPSITGSVHQKHSAYVPTQMLASSNGHVDDREIDGQ